MPEEERLNKGDTGVPEPKSNARKIVEGKPVTNVGEIDQVGAVNQAPWSIPHERWEDRVSVIGAIVAAAEGQKEPCGGDARDGEGCFEGGKRFCERPSDFWK